MNHEVEREELAKLRRLRERVMALPRYSSGIRESRTLPTTLSVRMDKRKSGEWIRASDIDEALKECQ